MKTATLLRVLMVVLMLQCFSIGYFVGVFVAVSREPRVITPSPEAAHEINELLDQGFTMKDPEGQDIERFEERQPDDDLQF